MGPFNRVQNYKISDADEIYRQHDIGYGKELAAGRSPYTRWNKYDQALMDAPALGWPDYVAKGIFGAKKFLTYGLPYVKGTRYKNVYGTPAPTASPTTSRYRTYTDEVSGWKVNETDAPVIYEGSGTDPDVLELQAQQAAQKWASKGDRIRDEFYTPGNFSNSAGGERRNIQSKIRYEKY